MAEEHPEWKKQVHALDLSGLKQVEHFTNPPSKKKKPAHNEKHAAPKEAAPASTVIELDEIFHNDKSLADTASERGIYTKCEEKDIFPEVFKKLQDFIQKPPYTKEYPASGMPDVYVSSTKEGDMHAPMTLCHTAEGNPYIIINEAQHIWDKNYAMIHGMTADDVFRAHMIDEEAAGRAETGQGKYMGNTGKGQNVFNEYQAISKKLGINPPPKLYLVNDDPDEVLNAHAIVTDNGNQYIKLDKRLYDHLNTEQVVAVLGHELGHFKNHDSYVETIMKLHNEFHDDKRLYRMQENAADYTSAKAHGGKPLAEALVIMEKLAWKDYYEGYKDHHYSASQLKEWFKSWDDGSHPPVDERVKNLHHADEVKVPETPKKSQYDPNVKH